MPIIRDKFTDYYKLLGIEPSASNLQIRRAFIQKAKQYHPDVGGSTESMRLLNSAYKTLNSYSHKAAYDLLHRFHTGKKEIDYRIIDSDSKNRSSKNKPSDEYIDWFIDTVYVEYSDTSNSKLTISKLIKKIFSTSSNST